MAMLLCVAMFAATIAANSSARRSLQTATANDVRVLIDDGRYERAEALARALADAAAAADGQNSLPAAVATDLLLHALSLNGKGALPSTLALAERTVQTKRSHLGALDAGLAPSLINLGNVLGEAGEHARAIPAIEKAVELQVGRGAQTPGAALADTLDALGVELIRAARYDEALRSLRQSLRIRDSLVGGATGLSTTLDGIVSALQWKADYAGARAPLQRALALFEARPEHPAHVQTLNLLGRQLWFEGNLPEAREASARAVALAERTLRVDHPGIAVALRNLAATVLDLGDIAAARSLQERALGIAQRSLGPTHHEMAAYLNALANSNMEIGAYPTARGLFEQALAITVSKFGSQNNSVATIVHNLALVDAHLGDYASARQRQARATAIWERVLRRDHPFVAVALMELAAVHRDQGAPAEALPLLERTLAIRERNLGPEHRDVARTLADLSATLMELGQPLRAQALATRALRILESVDAPDAPDLATVLDLYAQLQANRGDSLAARQYFERALAIREKVFGTSHPAFAETQARMALTLANLGNTSGALRAAATAETTGQQHLRLMLRYLPERQSLNYAATRPRGLDLMLSLVGASPDAVPLALDGLIRSRALVLDEMASRRRAGRFTSETTSPLGAELARAQQRLANLVVRGPGELPPARYAALVNDARRESERAERTLAEQNVAFKAEVNRAQIGLEQISDTLPEGSALVSFVRYARTEVARAAQTTGAPLSSAAASRTVTSYLAFVLKAKQPPVAIPLAPGSAIDSLVSQWRSDIAAEALAPARPSAPGTTRSSRSSGAALRKLIWDPVAGALNGVDRVFIVPDGTLSLVPFVALPVRESSYLIDAGPVIHYVSAERDLAASAAAASSDSVRGLLAIGGPAFDDRTLFGGRLNRGAAAPSRAQPAAAVRTTRSACGNFQDITFPRLDGALREVQEVATLWNAPDASAKRILVGRDASERTFKQEASQYRVLHLATHGFFLGDTCDRAKGGTRAVGGLTTASATSANELRRDNPLLLSGLALAGANRRASAQPEDDDGILTAEEVASLNLGGVEWAVLSACDTGLGEIKAGEGVFGLRRAFQVAGARTVIMSLWSVDDQATRAWMRALYDGRFQKRLTTADAVHAASIAVLRERRTKGQSTLPFYWAAFVAAGDWR